MGLSFVLHGTVPRDEIMGGLVGHVWYFFEDVFPPLHNGYRPFDPPRWWKAMFDGGTAPVVLEEQGTVGEVRPAERGEVGVARYADGQA